MDMKKHQLSLNDVGTFLRVLHDFGCREHWTRMWIVQESWLASKLEVLCGPDRLSINAFTPFLLDHRRAQQAQKKLKKYRLAPSIFNTPMRGTLQLSRHLQVHNRTHDQPLETSRSSSRGSQHSLGLLSTLRSYSGWSCRDFRDRLFAIRHIVHWPHGTHPPEPDYTVSSIDLFTGAVLQQEHTAGRPDLLKDIYSAAFAFPFRLGAAREFVAERGERYQRTRGQLFREIVAVRPLKELTVRNIPFRTADGRGYQLFPIRATEEKSALSRLCVDGFEKQITDIEWSYDEVQPRFNLYDNVLKSCKGGKPLFSDAQEIGRVPRNTVAGNWLVKPADRVDEAQPTWLVLAASGVPGILEITGYAIISTDWRPPRKVLQAVDLFFDPEDLMSYVLSSTGDCFVNLFDGVYPGRSGFQITPTRGYLTSYAQLRSDAGWRSKVLR